jgi:hypothetical protein
VYQNRILGRIFGPRDEVTGDWRKLHNLYSSLNIVRVNKSRRMRWVEQVVHMWDMRNAYKISVGKPEEKRPFRRLRHRWEDSVEMDLRDVRFWCMD